MGNRLRQWNRKMPVALMCAAVCAAAQAAQAQPRDDQQTAAANTGILDVVVSAQRDARPASRTPVSMTVLTGEQLIEAGVTEPSELGTRVPNVHLDASHDGLRITMRGVSNADTTSKGDPSAAFMLDGIYIARPQNQNVSLFDLARVEVLRGPQGTLYGRNATAGVVNLISNAPGKALEAAVSSGVGNFGSRATSAMVNIPVNEALALRAALAYNKHDSYLVNAQRTGFQLGRDRDDWSARLSARLALGGAGSLLLRYDSSQIGSPHDSTVPLGNFYTHDAAGTPAWKEGATAARLTNAFVPPNAPLQEGGGQSTSSGLGAELVWDLGPLTFHYLGAHRRFAQDYRTNFQYGLTPEIAIGVRYQFTGHYKQDSHEMRLSTKGSGPLAAQAGVYYFREQSRQLAAFRDLALLGLPPYYTFPMDPTIATSGALFGQATYSMTSRIRATLGARYSHDDKLRTGSTNFQQGAQFNPATDLRLLNAASLTTHRSTWRVGLEADLAPSSLLFATISTGYKAGGFNDGCLAGSSAGGIACPVQVAVPASALIYQPETLTSYEAGVKTRFLGNKGSVNATVFHYDYANLQLSGVAVILGAPRYVTTNAGVARVNGLELDGQLALGAAGRVSYALSLLEAHYAKYLPDGVHSWAGRKLDRSPRMTVALGYEHTFGLKTAQIKAGLFSRYSSRYVIGVPSQLIEYQVPARTQSDVNASYYPAHAHWSLHAYLKNIENEVRPVAIDSFRMVVPGDPRTWGARIDYRF